MDQAILESQLFRDIPLPQLEDLLVFLEAKEISLAEAEYLFRIGEKIERAALVISGSLLVSKDDYWGNRTILGEIKPREILAESFAALANIRSTVNALALKPSRILSLNLEKLHLKPDKYAQLLSRLVLILAQKNVFLNNRLEHLAQRTSKEKIMSYLKDRMIKEQKNSFYIPFNRQELADFLSVDRSALSTCLSSLKKAGVIDFKKNYFEVKTGVPGRN